jgi:16S rRNA (guanine527-N7)-methyltransferase
MNELWSNSFAKAGLSLDAEAEARLSRYLDLLIEANNKMNLTRITDRAQAELLHVADALTLLPHLPSKGCRLVDIGSGGGVPGLPLAIARPDVAVFLVESTKKKASFLAYCAEQLGLMNVTVSELRAEEVGRDPATRERFDVATARAVGTMDWLSEWCLPLLKVGGKVLAMKGPKGLEELPLAARAIALGGGGEAIIHPVELPGTDHRVIIEIPKQKKSDLMIPRPAPETRGKPLSNLKKKTT